MQPAHQPAHTQDLICPGGKQTGFETKEIAMRRLFSLWTNENFAVHFLGLIFSSVLRRKPQTTSRNACIPTRVRTVLDSKVV